MECGLAEGVEKKWLAQEQNCMKAQGCQEESLRPNKCSMSSKSSFGSAPEAQKASVNGGKKRLFSMC